MDMITRLRRATTRTRSARSAANMRSAERLGIGGIQVDGIPFLNDVAEHREGAREQQRVRRQYVQELLFVQRDEILAQLVDDAVDRFVGDRLALEAAAGETSTRSSSSSRRARKRRTRKLLPTPTRRGPGVVTVAPARTSLNACSSDRKLVDSSYEDSRRHRSRRRRLLRGEPEPREDLLSARAIGRVGRAGPCTTHTDSSGKPDTSSTVRRRPAKLLDHDFVIAP